MASLQEKVADPGAPMAPPARARHRHSPSRTPWYVVLGFMSLFIIGFGMFTLYPMVMVFFYSFTDFKVGSLNPVHFVGFANYIGLTKSTAGQLFGTAVKNTLWMVVVLVPVETIWAMLTAALINTYKRSVKVYRAIFYLPAMAPVVAAALSWLVMLNPRGPVTTVLERLHIQAPLWLGDPAWTKPTLTLMAMWMIGNTMVIFSAALLDVPKSLYEAAEIDGAGPVQRFFAVTLPAISPVIYFSVITGVIFTMQYFTQAYVISTAGHANQQISSTIGQPQNSLFFYVTSIYKQGFMFFKTYQASAMAVILFLVTLAITAVFVRVSRSLIYYQGEN